TRRNELSRLIEQNGGTYSKQLNHNSTHLVVCCPTDSAANDSEKVKWARATNVERKKSGSQALIQIVWEEWLFDSIDWQGKWDETNHRIDNPRPARKVLPELQAQETPFFDPPSFRNCTTSTQRIPGSSALHKSSSGDPGPSRLAQSSSGALTLDGEEQPEIAQIRRDHPTRPKDVLGNRLWADIVLDAKGDSGDSKGKGKQVVRPRRLAPGEETEDEDEVAVVPGIVEDGECAPRPSYLARMKSTRELAFAAPTHPVRRPSRATGKRELDPTEGDEGKVFAGLKLLTLGQALHDCVVKALTDNGGTVIRDGDGVGMDEVDYVIVRLREALRFVSPSSPHWAKFRTESWVELSIWEERLCDVSEQPGLAPFPFPLPVPGAETIRLCYSGLDSVQVTTVKRVCKALGPTAIVTDPFREGAKHAKALIWNIKVVDLDWLWEVARSGRIEGVNPENATSKQQSPIADITNTSSGDTEPYNSDTKTQEDAALKTSQAKAPNRLLSVSPTKGKQLAIAIPSPSAAQSPKPGSTTPSASSSSAQLSSAIAAMLGKRSSASGEQELDAEPPKKKSKRPARTRALADGGRLSASVSPARLGTSFVPPIHTMPETAFDELRDELGPDSMLVSYEDPAQKAQKMKIMALIKGETAPQLPTATEEDKRRRLPRKSKKAVSGA
ncbi:hypothetical protein FRB90_008023, partial [Tulasnella sp. 427]